MSKIPDMKEAAMSFEEKLTWVSATTTVIVVTAYAWIVGGQLAATPVAEIAYQRPMIIDGDLVGYYVSSVLMLGALALTMLEYEYFWIANAMFAAFVVAGLVSSAVKLVAYRRGF